jgi:G:T-mismatch repair DNA endonuclease (very short patch repair protein)
MKGQWKKGHTPWNKGKSWSEQVKEKIRSGNTGKVLSEEVKKSIGLAQIGNTHRKGMTAWNKDLTKETDGRVMKQSKSQKGKNGRTGSHHTEETKRKQRLAHVNIPKSEDHKRKISKTLKGHHVSEEQLKKWVVSNNLKPNKKEQQLNFILQEITPGEFKLNVRSDVMTLGGKIPDFVNINGQKKLIELYGDYWHKGQDINIRINYFKKFGWNTLVVWEKELKDIEALKNKILVFTHQL